MIRQFLKENEGTLSPSVLAMITAQSDPEHILAEYKKVYNEDPGEYLMLLFYHSVQSSHAGLLEILLQQHKLMEHLDLSDKECVSLSKNDLAMAVNVAVWLEDMGTLEIFLKVDPSLFLTQGKVISGDGECFLYTPLELAIRKDSVPVMDFLINHSPSELRHLGEFSGNPLHNSTKCMKHIISQFHKDEYLMDKDKFGRVPVVFAATQNIDAIPTLLEYGADPMMTHNGMDILLTVFSPRLAGEVRPLQMNLHPSINMLQKHDFTSIVRFVSVKRHRQMMKSNLLEVVKCLTSCGLRVNGKKYPLEALCTDINTDFMTVTSLEYHTLCAKYKSVFEFLVPLTNQTGINQSLLKVTQGLNSSNLCHNIDQEGHNRYLPLVQQIIQILLDAGAEANIKISHVPKPVANVRLNWPYLDRYHKEVPCTDSLKLLRRYIETYTPNRVPLYRTPLDILGCLLRTDPLEMKEEWIRDVSQIYTLLLKYGAGTHQPLHLLVILCIDADKYMKFLETYLLFQSHGKRNHMLDSLIDLTNHSALDDAGKATFQATRNRIIEFYTPTLWHISLSSIVRCLGKNNHPEKVEQLPVPTSLKKSINTPGCK